MKHRNTGASRASTGAAAMAHSTRGRARVFEDKRLKDQKSFNAKDYEQDRYNGPASRCRNCGSRLDHKGYCTNFKCKIASMRQGVCDSCKAGVDVTQCRCGKWVCRECRKCDNCED